MQSLTKQFILLLLSCVTITYVHKAFADYSYPFQPVYTKGDDLSRASVKPALIYNLVAGSEITIPNMPAYKTQDELGECRAFSLATLLQKYTCDQWKAEIPDCKSLPENRAISHFGMMTHTNRNISEAKTFEPNQGANAVRSMDKIIRDISDGGGKFILDSCKPFDKVVNSFNTIKQGDLDKRNKFFSYLKRLFENRKNTTEANIADCPDCLEEIAKSGLNVNLINLKRALMRDDYNKFLYDLFFEDCKFKSFPVDFNVSSYPDDALNVSSKDIKNQAIEGLKKGNPVLFPSLCLSQDRGGECTLDHSIVVSGFKKVCSPQQQTICKDLFKVHNSWGSEWQKINNDGWIDADVFTSNLKKIKIKDSYKIASSSVIWLEP